MPKNLVIVESPAKSKTIRKYLGPDYAVLASYGHVRDLRPKSGAIDTERDYSMVYEPIERNQKHVDAIARELKKSNALYLATDPDREGEAISWHLCELLKDRGALAGKQVKRVVFHEITKTAITDAIKNPRQLSTDLINAQQARRALDYLVGFNLSPLLWKKIHRGLSAGRVQSPALRMIVERELEIEKFESKEYWTIEADLHHAKADFVARLSVLNGEKVKQFSITNQKAADQAATLLNKAANGVLVAVNIDKKQRRRQPAPPFITSTLQQEAARKLGFSTQKTMRVAQQLYEGVDTGQGAVGLITYMRTDSVTLAAEAVRELRQYIADTHGAKFLPEQPRVFKNKSKNAQEAHEAVRPTSIRVAPKDIKRHLDADQFKLYDLVWKRALASQMANVLIDTVAVDLACGDGNMFRANGSTVAEPGFMKVYAEGSDDKKEPDAKTLPPIKQGDKVKLRQIRQEQHFTEPPPRYSEASLVKSLEEHGIGRPSTYANIISTLRNREYVEMERKRFIPTDVGRVVNKFLTNHFMDYVDYAFTAKLEDELDAVSRGEKEWVPLMREFWLPFSKIVKEKEQSVSRGEALQARELGTDPKSGLPVSVRIGRYGPYAQIGSKDDEEKPRFAGLRPGQKMETITFAEAMALFKLPRALGDSPQGEEIVIGIGRFGPYVRYDSKFVSIPKEDDPYTIDLQRALELVQAKKQADAEKQIRVFTDAGVSVLNGRYGPYITDGEKNAKVPKDKEPKTLTLTECRELLAAAPPGWRGKKKVAAKKTTAKKTAAKKTTKKTANKAAKKKSAKKTAKA